MCKAVGEITFNGITGQLIIHRNGRWAMEVTSPGVVEEVRFSVSPVSGETVAETTYLGEL